MKITKRYGLFAGLLLGGLLGLSPLYPAFAADAANAAKPAPTTRPATQPTTHPAARSLESIQADLTAAQKELGSVITSLAVFTDEKKRVEIAPKAIPAMKKFMAAFGELADQNPIYRGQAASMRGQFLSMMTVLGDADARAELTSFLKAKGTAPSRRRAG